VTLQVCIPPADRLRREARVRDAGSAASSRRPSLNAASACRRCRLNTLRILMKTVGRARFSFFGCETCAYWRAVGVSPPARPTRDDTGGLTSAARLFSLRLCRSWVQSQENLVPTIGAGTRWSGTTLRSRRLFAPVIRFCSSSRPGRMCFHEGGRV
jgi:hypothetical protein